MNERVRSVVVLSIVLMTLLAAFVLIRSVQVPYHCPNMSQIGVCDPPGPVFDRRLELRALVVIVGLTMAWWFSRIGRRPADANS